MDWSRLMPFHYSDSDLRDMYAGQRGNATARRFARFWSTLFALGVAPRRWVTLEVVGRTSGKVLRFPLGEADLDGKQYLVSMLGNDCNWVRNVRAAHGHAFLVRRRRSRCILLEVPVDQRAPIIKRYLNQVPGARPHIPVDRHAAVAAFELISPDYPVFLITTPQATRQEWVSREPFAPATRPPVP
jgi:hypothetical protein